MTDPDFWCAWCHSPAPDDLTGWTVRRLAEDIRWKAPSGEAIGKLPALDYPACPGCEALIAARRPGKLAANLARATGPLHPAVHTELVPALLRAVDSLGAPRAINESES